MVPSASYSPLLQTLSQKLRGASLSILRKSPLLSNYLSSIQSHNSRLTDLSNLCLFNLERMLSSSPCTSAWKNVSRQWEQTCTTHLICFSFQGAQSYTSNFPVFKIIFFIHCAQFSMCLRREDKSSSCYCIIARSFGWEEGYDLTHFNIMRLMG